MANAFDEFDTTTEPANAFDEFDVEAVEQPQKVNSFDEFDTTKGSVNAFDEFDNEGPATGDIVKGVGVEIASGIGGQLAGAAIGTAILPGVGTAIGYGVGSIGSGIAGSIAAQNIEGQEDISWGRAIAAGLINLVPGGAAKGVKGAAKITGAVVGKAAAKEAAKGAAFGATEATSRAIIDEGRLPTKEELAQYGGAGALFGGALGAATPKIGKTFDKFLGKSAGEIDDAIGRGEIEFSDFEKIAGKTTEGAPSLIGEFAESRAAIQSQMAADAIAEKGLGKMGQVLASVAPSRFVGNKAQQAAINFTRDVKRADELGSRIARRVEKESLKDPAISKQVDDILDGGTTPMTKELYQSVGADLDKFKETRLKLQEEMLELVDSEAYRKMNPVEAAEFKKVLQDSIAGKAYTRRDYRMFIDKDFKQDPKLRREALKELEVKMGKDKAKAHMARLENSSAKTRAGDPRSSGGQGVDSIMKRRQDPGAAERAWLGEVTDAPERIRGTLTGLGRSVARAKADDVIGRELVDSGLASKSQAGDMKEIVLRGTGAEGTGIYANPEVQTALNQIYLPSIDKGSENIFLNGLQDLYRSGVAGSKASKVLLNTVAYPVQFYGNTMTLAGQAINPFRGAKRGMSLALAEFGGIEGLTKNPKARKAMLDDIDEMATYGIKNANIIDSDIRNTIDDGIFSKILGKATDPLGKAYSVPDTMGRYVGWKASQRSLRKQFPNATPEQIKAQAAELINNTYQNYDKLSNTIRTLSRWGVMPQFASFTAEFMRNQYNQGKVIAQMMRGTYGAGAGLGTANIKAMKIEGAKRLAAITAVYASTYGAVEGVKRLSGVTPEKEDALRDVVYAPWEKDRDMMVSLDNDGNAGWTANMSYISPHALGISALKAGMSGQDEESLVRLLANEMIGDGSFVMQEAFRALSNKQKSGKPITNELNDLKNVQDRLSFFVRESFRPGFSRELDKLKDARLGRNDITLKDVGQRQLGARKNIFTIDKNAMFTIKGNADAAKAASGEFTSTKRKDPTPEELNASYDKANRIRREAFDAIVKNNQSLIALDRDEGQRIEIMKKAGVSSKDILSVLNGTYRDLQRVKLPSTSDTYEGLPEGESAKRKAIMEIRKTDRALATRLMQRMKREKVDARRGVTTQEGLMKNLDVGERARMIMAHPNPTGYLREMQRKGIATKQVVDLVRLMQRGQ